MLVLCLLTNTPNNVRTAQALSTKGLLCMTTGNACVCTCQTFCPLQQVHHLTISCKSVHIPMPTRPPSLEYSTSHPCSKCARRGLRDCGHFLFKDHHACTLSGCWGVHLAAAFMVSGYMGVTKPLYRGRQDKWLAQSKPHGVWRYGFDTPEEGAEWLAKQLELKDVGALARGRPSSELAVSGYRGVVRHLRPTGKPYFEARARGVTVSTHATDVGAAMVVAKKRRVSVESLKKSSR